MALAARHELKYFISQGQYQVLSRLLGNVLWHDEHADDQNEYHIRSLYFDTIYNTAMHEKISGTADRNKYRIRFYNFSDRFIRMECKTKIDTYISKRSVPISRNLCEQLIAGDPSGLEHSASGLMRDVFREMRINLLRPAVVVDYVREAYVHPAEEVRITFDKQLRSGLCGTDIFNKHLPVYPPFKNPDQIILEVKFNRLLPSYISTLLSQAVGNAHRSAISKYVICRQHEGLDY